MTRVQSMLAQLEMASALLTVQISRENAALSRQYYTQLLHAYQIVSLAENKLQVKNGCSPMSSEKR